MKNTLLKSLSAMLLIAALSVKAQQAPSTVVAQTITAQTSLAATQVAPLLAAASIPNGYIRAMPNGTMVVRWQSTLTMPVSSITNLVVPPNGIDPTNFVSGRFVVDTNGNFQVTGTWNIPPQ